VENRKIAMISIHLDTLDTMEEYWLEGRHGLIWDCPFVLPQWLKAWWSVFGKEYELLLCTGKYMDRVAGIAPLMARGDRAWIIGDRDTCDYGTIIFNPASGYDFMGALFLFLRNKGIKEIEIKSIEHSLLSHLLKKERFSGVDIKYCISDRTYGIHLPATWDEYLASLSGKYRHEIRRKLRRLHGAGNVEILILSRPEECNSFMDTFIHLFRSNIPAKRAFMTPERALFFKRLVEYTSRANLVRIIVLNLNNNPVAATLCFDLGGHLYLYNNGYDINFSHLSVGLLSKVFSIQYAIESGKRYFDFLRGDEKYKQYLGGTPSSLFEWSLSIKPGDGE